MSHTKSQPSRSRAKGVLAVRMLVAKTDWLTGHTYWRDGQVTWITPKGPTVPSPGDLARTQHSLNKISGLPNAACIALGDSHDWLSRRCLRLELAKRLRAHSGSDIEQLAREARRRNPTVASALSRLLTVEALCLNPLPTQPSAVLVALGEAAIVPLQTLLRDKDTPPAARALMALTLGAIGHAANSPFPLSSVPLWTASAPDGPLDRAFRWGQRHGLPSEPALVSALLANGDGHELTGRYLRAAAPPSALGLPTELLRELLAEGVPPATVIALAEEARTGEAVAMRILNIRKELPDLQGRREERWTVSDALRTERGQAIDELNEAITAFARATRDPRVLNLTMAFLHQMLDLSDGMMPYPWVRAVVLEQAGKIMRLGLRLPPAMQRHYWELLVERHGVFWNRTTLPAGHKAHRERSRLRSWLHEIQCRHITPLCKLLALTQARQTVVAALDLGIHQMLAEHAWSDPDRYRLLVTLAADLELPPGHYFLWELCRILDTFTDAREARPYFQALLQPMQACPPRRRRHLLETLFREAGHTHQAIHHRLPGIVPHLAALVRFDCADDQEWCVCGPVFAAALSLARAIPAQAKERLDWLLPHLAYRSRRKARTDENLQSLQIGLLLAVALAAEDAERFQAIVRTTTQHCFRQDPDQIAVGLRLLERFPALRKPLAYQFPQQPQRVTDMLVRLALLTRLGTDTHPLLGQLVAQRPHGGVAGTCFPVLLSPDAGWWKIHRLMPDLTESANSYLHAQWLMGQSLDLPMGVRRALDRPHRAATELTYLEQVLRVPPDRADLAARAAKLRDLLDDPSRVAAEVCAEVRERLPRLATQAQIAALEQRVRACYCARLDAVGGPLPPDLELTDDLINATLLTVDISHNRRLLLRLLRSYLAGDHEWREKHPANRAFLESLAGRGVGVATWLSNFPAQYPCGQVPGHRVHLRLESDPLHILQMGNHFDTCLSRGSVNAFSTVANACELNKRVIYASDSLRRVVGRQLIGINEDGDLIGFHTYCAMTDEAGNQTLRRIFRRYAARFASRCGLTLADTGTVPRLFAEAWYDDGAVAWGDATSAPRQSESDQIESGWK